MGLSFSQFIRVQPSHQPVPAELPRGHIPALDGIRGLAILLVTIYRFSGIRDYPTPEWLHTILEFGSRGVDLFFVLSGFLITGILFDAKGEECYFRNFYARRTLRIFPLYYVTLILVLILLPLLGVSGQALKLPSGDLTSLWFYASNIVMSIRGKWNFGGLNHFWSLCIEEHFYLVWPLVIACCSRIVAMRVCLAVFCLSSVARINWLLLDGNEVAAEVFTLFRLDALCAGAWLALAARGENGFAWLVPRAKLTAVVTTLVLLSLGVLGLRLLTVPTTLFACQSASIIVLAVASSRTGGLLAFLGNSRLLQWLGRYSYGMYVYQNLLLYGMVGLLTPAILADATGSHMLGRCSYVAIMSLLTAGVAWLSWQLFESRCLVWKRCFSSHQGEKTHPPQLASGGAEETERQAIA